MPTDSKRKRARRGEWNEQAPDLLGNHRHRFVDTGNVPANGQPRAVDLFCGAGGISHGFEAAGFRTVLAVDKANVEPPTRAAMTYRLNFPHVWMDDRGIECLSDRELLSGVGDDRPHVVAGGPPCQAFSTSGKRDPNDPKARLYREFLRVVAALRPQIVVIENVPGLAIGKCRTVLGDIAMSLDDLGYPEASVLKLNAAWYGVPQIRERIVIIANRTGRPNPYPRPLFQLQEYVTVRQAIADLADLPRDPHLSHDWPLHGPDLTADLQKLRCGENAYDYHEAWERLDPDGPAPTVKSNNGGSAVHPWLPRTLTVREMARLQGFPDSFRFLGGVTAERIQVANAVPPEMARHIALALRGSLEQVA